jgi:hypothetical protein
VAQPGTFLGKRQAQSLRRQRVRRAADLFRRRPFLEALEDRTVFAVSLSIPTNVPGALGGTVLVPVLVNQLDDGQGNTGLSAADLDINYDPARFTVNPAQVQLGSLLSPAHWALSASVKTDVPTGTFPNQNELIIRLTSPDGAGYSGTNGGSLVNIPFQVNAGDPVGTYPLNLANDNTNTHTDAFPFFGATSQPYALNPAPTNASNDPVDGSIAAGSTQALEHFAVTASPTTVTAGTQISVMVTPQLNGQLDTNYNGTVHFSSTDPQADLPADLVINHPTGPVTVNVTLKTAGNETITVFDTAHPAQTGTSNSVLVNPGSANHYALSGIPNPVSAGFTFNFTVTAQDLYNNTATGYAGTVHFFSIDQQATLPPDSTLTNGVGRFSAYAPS